MLLKIGGEVERVTLTGQSSGIINFIHQMEDHMDSYIN